MRTTVVSLAGLLLAAACGSPPDGASTRSPMPALDLADLDHGVDPGVDFYRFANGGWLDRNPLPPDAESWGTFAVLREQNAQQLRAILEDCIADTHALPGSDRRLLGDFYRAAMDEDAIERDGMSALGSWLAGIAGIRDAHDLARVIGELHRTAAPQAAFLFYRGVDVDHPGQAIATLAQGGVQLPDPAQYAAADEDARALRRDYQRHVARMFELLGEDESAAGAAAEDAIGVEAALAAAFVDPATGRESTEFHRTSLTAMAASMPGFCWTDYGRGLGLDSDRPVHLAQPRFFAALAELATRLPVAAWRHYLTWNLVATNAELLGEAVSGPRFEFFDRRIAGLDKRPPRWRRVLIQVENCLGWTLAREYVARHFDARARDCASEMVREIRATLRQRLATLDWMSEPTRRRAVAKLDAIAVAIGYPDEWPAPIAALDRAAAQARASRGRHRGPRWEHRWGPPLTRILARREDSRDFGPMVTTVVGPGYLAQVVAASSAQVDRDLATLDEPIDRGAFGMTPQQVNAYYSPVENKIVFPAGILQPPFFDDSYDVAVRLGGIGAVIAHEFTHAFDDEGSRYDGRGQLVDWWTEADRAEFERRREMLIAQYSAYEALPGLHVDGRLTVGENIADLGGVSIALATLQRLLPAAERARRIDGFDAEQRFFLAWARLWRCHVAPATARIRAATSTTSPFHCRVVGPLGNLPEFAAAFGLHVGQPMVRAPDARIRIW